MGSKACHEQDDNAQDCGQVTKQVVERETTIPNFDLTEGDEVERPASPEEYACCGTKHTGIYVGQGFVISKYPLQETTNATVGVIMRESLTQRSWADWSISLRGSLHSAKKAMIFYEGYCNKVPETYDIHVDNCHTFSEKCLAEGLKSTVGSQLFSD